MASGGLKANDAYTYIYVYTRIHNIVYSICIPIYIYIYMPIDRGKLDDCVLLPYK